ncbi:MAG: diguanylate cyclase domain/uncharacterized domain [Capsulimonas sp.]|jgi:diguanylate cyclase (GGDEF)-like protein/putative nucleotidyltransferase with HDIG domain|nr:diguanylate cyclase domain/uncharacterized domain [Capsulimonas sp.]
MAKVLLADDEEALRLMLGRQLRRGGHEVTLAEDGQMALEFLQQGSFDLVVSDMKMPRLDGMGLLEAAHLLTPETEFIILTGHGSMENAVEAFKTGRVFDYLLKPLEDIRELDAVVTRAVERRTLRSENGRLVNELEARISELEAAKAQLADLAERDGLTGLFNHKTIHHRLETLLETIPDDTVSVMMLDMDGFKLINDTYGHPTGDKVLRHLARSLEAICGEKGVLGRCGGDEFMVILPSTTGVEAQGVANDIKQYLGLHPFKSPDGANLPVRLCFGVADTRSAGCSAPNLVTAADTALYEGKSHGGDQVTLHLQHVLEGVDPSHGKFEVLDGLVTAIDRKDHYTKRHSEDVTGYALKLVDALGLSGETLDAVRVAGLLHDIGKIGVPDSILRKPGKLTAEEYEVMKGHVTLSMLIIHGLPRLNDILDAVSHHHERWDGKGYPSGVAGEDIPLLGRVMAVADAFSAMTLDRPYRSGMSIDDALGEIERGSGSQFDPQLAELFIEIIRAQEALHQQAA